MPCPDCGASVAARQRALHRCDPERQVEYQLFQLRGEVEAFEGQLSAYLDSADETFAQWLAERDRPL